MKYIVLGPNANKFYQIAVTLPRSVVELKSYCLVNPAGLRLSNDELKFALDFGLQKLIESGAIKLQDSAGQQGKVEPAEPEKIETVVPESTEPKTLLRRISDESLGLDVDVIPVESKPETVEEVPQEEEPKEPVKKARGKRPSKED